MSGKKNGNEIKERTIKMKVFRTNEIDTDTYRVGDVISFTLTYGKGGSEEVEAMAVKQENDGMIFCMVDCLEDEQIMNREDTNIGGYDASDLRSKLNGKIIKYFPADLRERMVAFENGDLLRLPAGHEIFGDVDGKEQWEPMKFYRNKIAFQGKNGYHEWYWLMDTSKKLPHFATVDNLGLANSDRACSLYGVRPVFKLLNKES